MPLALLVLALLEGLAALIFGLYWGFTTDPSSGLWLASTVLVFAAWLSLATGAFILQRGSGRRGGTVREAARLSGRGVRRLVLALLFILGIASFEFFLFSFMFLPVYFRWYALWGMLLSLQGWLLVRWLARAEPALSAGDWRWPRISRLDRGQRVVFWILAVILGLNFIAAIPGNLHGTRDRGDFLDKGEDELVIYPIVTTMVQPAENFRVALYQFIEYDDYHYGYPFYLLSALVVLPSRILYGSEFSEQYWLNLPLLRQIISVLPILLSALLITYLGTRFRSLLPALVVLLLILTTPAVLKYEQFFWHPDGLAVLFVVLTLFFLDRDRLRFGLDFYLAALFCGLATAVRLVGAFFFLAIAGYLAAGWLRERIFRRTFLAGAGFLSLMMVTVLLSNPFLFDSGARGRMLATMNEKTGEMTQGYQDSDPFGVYQTGWEAWLPFFDKDYSPPWYLAILVISALLATLVDRVNPFPAALLGWVLAMGGYLVYFVAVKSFQYGLPLFVPLYGAALLLPDALQRVRNPIFQRRSTQMIIRAVVILLGVFQIIRNILDQTPFSG